MTLGEVIVKRNSWRFIQLAIHIDIGLVVTRFKGVIYTENTRCGCIQRESCIIYTFKIFICTIPDEVIKLMYIGIDRISICHLSGGGSHVIINNCLDRFIVDFLTGIIRVDTITC